MPFTIPHIVSTKLIICVFIGCLIGFHIVLIWLLKLNKIWWKRVDYIWLGLAAFSLIGGAAKARQIVATGMLPWIEAHKESAYKFVNYRLNEEVDSNLVCRTFVRSQYSPPPEEFDRVQHEYDNACKWFKEQRAITPTEIPQEQIPMPICPQTTEEAIQHQCEWLRESVQDFNQTVAAERQIQDATQQSEPENIVAILIPALLAVALALRITKVTADIKLG